MAVEKAIFAGGCFWCMVKPFDTWEGVHSVISGYTGGQVENPTYEQVKTGETGHYEAVEITFNPEIISYDTILDLYWKQIDPTDAGGQFHDRGSQYRTAIFHTTPEQKEKAQQSKEKLAESGTFKKPIVTEILPATRFYPAEEYHQDFYKKEKEVYEKDRAKSGRDEFIETHWNVMTEN
ncbi:MULTISPECIES: peptide-methionine (S)-S-oxide reductase MsrA [unclassified Oceanobacillus]|uniref:peptide-methionine (S)-S-oxide reductase MsrA n=1 Tax=unclassified Oceanobacillus TaxID=2630292 RepID=UPI00300E6B30